MYATARSGHVICDTFGWIFLHNVDETEGGGATWTNLSHCLKKILPSVRCNAWALTGNNLIRTG